MRNYHVFWIIALFTIAEAQGAAITVNTATDDFGSNLSNCSLREAIQSANNNADFGGCDATGLYNPAITDVITLPAIAANTFFTLTRVGTDDTNNSGDLDIDGNVNINGVSAANSVIRGNVNDLDNQRHRLVHIINPGDGEAVFVVLNDLTLHDGLEDGSTAGGGLRSELNTTTTLNRVTVTLNTAGGNAGGILNRNTMTINDSLISNNQTVESEDGGGGIFSSGANNSTLTINNSRILNNTVNSSATGKAGGGGIYVSGGSLSLNSSVVDGNLADGRRVVGDRDAFGGGLYTGRPATLVQSSITNNDAVGKYSRGGGIHLANDSAVLLDRSVISFNLAESEEINDGQAYGGGVDTGFTGSVTIQDSVISGNEASAGAISEGGGLNGEFNILRSTVANNSVNGPGGGLHTTASVVINSTFIGNEAEVGGGVFVSSSLGQTSQVFSSTVAGNTASDTAGGINRGGNAVLMIANTVLAGNSAANSGPDCAGTITTQDYNLIQNTSGCGFIPFGSDKININADLASAANNGGPTAGSSLGIVSAMSTRAPLSTSPLIDAGNPLGCKDEDDLVLATDQIGRDRAIDGPDVDTAVTCDIGAIEFSVLLFEDGFE